MQEHNTHLWRTKLRSQAGLCDAVALLAQAMGEASGAGTSGVFLLDYTGQNLLLFASWSAGKGAVLQTRQALAMDAPQDPLCFSLQNGAPYLGTVQEGLPLYPSLALLTPISKLKMFAAAPLITWGDTCIGGMVLGFQKDMTTLDSETTALIDFGAVLLDSIIRQQRDHALLNSLREDIGRLDTVKRKRKTAAYELLIGQSQAMQSVREQIAKAAPYDVPILITGETGTGKELVASAIHAASSRSAAPFVKVNCGALPAPLLESELFGHKKGSFSGASANHIGLLRSAEGGTVLLDEVGEMPLELQVKLLRVLQDHQIRPVGDVCSYPVDIRILSATNTNLEEAIAAGGFRRDLYHRLGGFHLHVPPLRERMEDIPVLAEFYLEKFAAQHQCGKQTIHPDAMQSLFFNAYPGNVRQFFSDMEHAILSAGNSASIRAEHFTGKKHGQARHTNMSLRDYMSSYENSIITSTLSYYNGNIANASIALGIPRTTLNSKLNKTNQEKYG